MTTPRALEYYTKDHRAQSLEVDSPWNQEMARQLKEYADLNKYPFGLGHGRSRDLPSPRTPTSLNNTGMKIFPFPNISFL